jgi:hypothetical protein
MKKLKDESGSIAARLAGYKTQAEGRMAALAASKGLDAAAQAELEGLQLVLHAALAQVDVLARQAALAELLQHRLGQQEEVLAALQVRSFERAVTVLCMLGSDHYSPPDPNNPQPV